MSTNCLEKSRGSNHTGFDFLAFRSGNVYGQQTAGGWGGLGHRYFKKQKARLERRRAKINPECVSGYSKWKGWFW